MRRFVLSFHPLLLPFLGLVVFGGAALLLHGGVGILWAEVVGLWLGIEVRLWLQGSSGLLLRRGK